jgi:uncharacterized protein
LLRFAKNNPAYNISLNESLSWAAHNGHLEVVSVLINSNAEVNYQDVQGNTALHWAAYHDHTPIIELLIRKGAKKDLSNKNGHTAATFANIYAKKDIKFPAALIANETTIINDPSQLTGLEPTPDIEFSPSGSPSLAQKLK